MPKYQYKAKNMAGRIMEGVYDAPNQNAVVDMIRQKSFYCLSVEEIVERKDLNETGFLARIKSKDLSVYCRQFSSILRAGVTLLQCLNMLGEQTENKALKYITNNVKEEVQKGSSLSQAMDLHNKKLPSILINMVAAGEASGTLDNSFAVMANHFEKENKTSQKVKSALTYPIIVAIVAIAVVIFLLIKVVPVFENMFANSGNKLPLPTRILLGMSGFLKTKGYIILMVVIIMVVIFKIYVSGEAGRLKFDKFKLRLPLIGKFLTKSISARFARTMATLMSSGVAITEALEITSKITGNTYTKKSIQNIIGQVKEGKSLYTAMMSTGLFPQMLQNMVMLGEESGTLDNMLTKTAEFYEDEVDRAAQRLTTLLEPIIIVFLGGMVAFIVISIMLPMFDSYSMVS